ncbi:MAG: hypothetical protein C0623_00730 [Desulfuromonas sp.]|nr:MAG: hypothetical protein C0623_00730 [Desulfuromonas sp.]
MAAIIRKCVYLVFFYLPERLVDQCIFEIVGFFGRLCSRSYQPNDRGEALINLGSGGAVVPGFVNIDFFGTAGVDYSADLRFPLKIPSNTACGIFSEHTLEHLTYTETENLLRECYRIIVPGGGIRIVVPDLSIFMQKYIDNDLEWFRHWEQLYFKDSANSERSSRTLLSPVGAVSFVTQEYGHVSCWDFPAMKIVLEKAGFSRVKKVDFRDGEHTHLMIEQDCNARRFVSLYVEAEKSA